MNQSLDALRAKFHSKPLCKEESWDFTDAGHFQYALYVQRHGCCDTNECVVDTQTKKAWRHDPGNFGLQYKPEHTEPVYAAAEKAERKEMDLEQLTQLVKSMAQ